MSRDVRNLGQVGRSVSEFALRASALACSVVLAAALSACSPSGKSTVISADKPGAPSTLQASGVSVLDHMFDAPEHVAHEGRRRLEYHFESEGAPQTLIYEEHVVADGQGQFALDPGQVIAPAMTTPQREIFEALQKEREGFFFRYRDFGVRQSPLFKANYVVTDLGSRPMVAGCLCIEFSIHRLHDALSTYLVAVDPTTGLVMRCSEFDRHGNLLARSEFLEFTLSPNLDGVEWFQGRFASEAFDDHSTVADELGFHAQAPRFVPSGYQLVRSELVHIAGRAWVRRVYSDGVESLFFMHGGPAVAPSLDPHATNPIHASHTPLGGPNAEPFTVRVCQVGPWTMAEVKRGAENMIVVGKVGEDEVARILQSSL